MSLKSDQKLLIAEALENKEESEYWINQPVWVVPENDYPIYTSITATKLILCGTEWIWYYYVGGQNEPFREDRVLPTIEDLLRFLRQPTSYADFL